MKILKGRINDLEGFVIQDLLEPKKAALTIPPFLTRKWSLQLTSKKLKKKRKIYLFACLHTL